MNTNMHSNSSTNANANASAGYANASANTQRKMYKVLTRIEKKGGGSYWMRLGTAFTNKDDSLNLFLDAMPATNAQSHRYELHIRELDAEDLRRRESYAGAGNSHGSGRDLGGNGGGPGTRAVTAGGSGLDDVPF